MKRLPFIAVLLLPTIVLSAILLSAFLLPAGALMAQVPTPSDGTTIVVPEEGIVKFEITGVGSLDMVALLVGDTLLLPFGAVSDFLSIEHHTSANLDTISGELPVGMPFMIVRSASICTYRGRSEPFDRSLVRVVDGVVYVERGLLGTCYGIQLAFDSASIIVRMPASLKVPAVTRFQKSKRYAALAMGRSPQDADGAVATPIDRQLLGGIALDWSLASAYQNGVTPTGYGFFRAGGPLLFGVFDVNGVGTYNRASNSPFSLALGSWQWQFLLPDFSALRRITVGGIAYAGHQRLSAEISNMPTVGRYDFTMHTISGHATPGWTAELYDGSALLQIMLVDSNGRYQFEVPLGYSPTTLTVQAIGPHGEQETTISRLEIHHSQVPPGMLDYTARMSVDGLARTDAVDGVAMLRAGIAEWLTIGADLRMHSSSRASIGLDSIEPVWHVLTWLGASAQLGLSYASKRRILGGEFGYTFPGETSLRLTLEGYSLAEHAIAASGNINLPLGTVALNLNSRYLARDGSSRLEATPQVVVYVGGVGITAATNFLWADTDSLRTELRTELRTPPYHGFVSSWLRVSYSPFQSLYLSAGGTLDHRSGIVAKADISSSYYLGPFARVGVAYAVDSMKLREGTLRSQVGLTLLNRAVYLAIGYSIPHMEWKRGGFTADLRCDLGFGRLRGQTIHSDGHTSGVTTFDGGLLISAAGIETRNDPTVGRGAIVVRAFSDDNANGIWDSNELELGAFKASIAYRSMEMMSRTGEFYNVTPDADYLVTVDRWAFAGRELFPRRSAFRVYTMASTVTIVDVAFAPGFDVVGSGQVVLSDGTIGGNSYLQALNALPVRLVAVDGTAEFDGEMFGDGSMVFLGVSAGEYRLDANEHVLAERGLRQRNRDTTFVLAAAQRRNPPVQFEMVAAGSDRGR